MSFIKKIGFFTAFIIPSLAVAGFYLGGSWNWLTIIFVFVLIPVSDALIGEDLENIPEHKEPRISAEQYYRFVTFIWAYAQYAFLFWALWAVSTHSLSADEWVLFTISVALSTGGIGITVAHELGHKPNRSEQLTSQALLLTVCYSHFFIEHNRGHHVRVATKEDPATSREGEHFYSFWARSVFGGFSSALELEKDRLTKKGLPVFSLHNQMIRLMLIQALFIIAVVVWTSFWANTFAWWAVLFFFAQSIPAFSLLELVNYIEHYGLQRRELSDGRYEQVTHVHSWNASHLISNFFLFQLQRHSDHHAKAHRRYQVLRHFDESPQLPSGYPAMILAALVPPLWFKLMDKRLADWKEKYHPQEVAA